LDTRQREFAEKADLLAFLDVIPNWADTRTAGGSDVAGLLRCLCKLVPGDPVNVTDAALLECLEIPPEARPEIMAWDGWNAVTIRKVVAQLADRCGMTLEELVETAAQIEQPALAQIEADVGDLEVERRKLRREVRVCEDRLRRRRMLCEDNTLDKNMRYEAHLSRQMQQALHTLERLQAARAGRDVPVPSALDITVDADASSTARPASAAAAVLKHTGGA
jgi:hypothetical protein